MDHVAAIDAGSNGIRLVIGAVNTDGVVEEVFNVRKAVRLGADAFGTGRFSSSTIDLAAGAFAEFRTQLDRFGVIELRAVATSASREAENADELVAAIASETRIHLEIIDGLEEAQLVFRAVDGGVDLRDKRALLIDMGGGSVEVTVARNRRALACETLPLGPVRLLQRLKESGLGETDVPTLLENRRGVIRSMIQAEFERGADALDIAVGTGGNISRMAKLARTHHGNKNGRPVPTETLRRIVKQLSELSIQQRIDDLGMRPDRADVVGIACRVLLAILEDASIDALVIPRVGLKEGLLRDVARRLVATAGPPHVTDGP